MANPLKKAAVALSSEQGSEKRKAAGATIWKDTKLPSGDKTVNKKTPQFKGESMTMSKAKRAVTYAADAVGLDGKPGFQNTFGSIKGMGKMKSKKK